jgi:hypothetical protein
MTSADITSVTRAGMRAITAFWVLALHSNGMNSPRTEVPNRVLRRLSPNTDRCK